MDKMELYKRYVESLKRSGIRFSADDNNYVIKIAVGGRTIECFSSKNWWRDQSKNVKGNGLARLIAYVKEQENLAIREDRILDKKAKELALALVKEKFQNLSFINRFIGKRLYKQLLKELYK